MNILHITTFLQGGAGRIIYNLAKDQKENGNTVVVITSKTSEPGYENYDEYIDGLKEAKIPTYKIDSSFKRDLYLNLRMVEQVREIIKQYDIDIIHAHAAIPALIGMISRQVHDRYVPVLQTMHGYGLNKNLYQQEMDKIIMNGLDRVVAVSKDSEKILIEKGIETDKIQVIYNGIMEEYELYIEEDIDLYEVKDWKSLGYKVFGCIGTVCDRKNQALFLEAINKINDDSNNRFVFLGEGDLLDKLREKAIEYGLQDKVRFFGYKKNAKEYLKNFDCLVLPSKSEGLSIVIIEAFREKVPVIASDINAFKELITDGLTGILFKSDCVNELVKAINKVASLLDSQRWLIVQQSYELYQKELTFDIMKEKYMNLYNELLQK